MTLDEYHAMREKLQAAERVASELRQCHQALEDAQRTNCGLALTTGGDHLLARETVFCIPRDPQWRELWEAAETFIRNRIIRLESELAAI